MTPEVAAQVTAIMEEVVEHGTATRRSIPGYTVAGKTGTAEKLVDGGLHRIAITTRRSSGSCRRVKPVYTIVVVIDSPHGPNGYFGGPVAAPVFRRIAEALLRHGGVPPTFNPPPPVLVQREPASAPRTAGVGPERASGNRLCRRAQTG